MEYCSHYRIPLLRYIRFRLFRALVLLWNIPTTIPMLHFKIMDLKYLFIDIKLKYRHNYFNTNIHTMWTTNMQWLDFFQLLYRDVFVDMSHHAEIIIWYAFLIKVTELIMDLQWFKFSNWSWSFLWNKCNPLSRLKNVFSVGSQNYIFMIAFFS